MYTQSIPLLPHGQIYAVGHEELKSALDQLNQLMSCGAYGVVANLTSESFIRRDDWVIISLLRLFKEYVLTWIGQTHYYEKNQSRLLDIQTLADRKWVIIKKALINLHLAQDERKILLKQHLRILQAWQNQMESQNACLAVSTGNHLSTQWKLAHFFPRDSVAWLKTYHIEHSIKQKELDPIKLKEIRQKCADAAEKRHDTS